LAPTVGNATTGFRYPGGIFQLFIDKISKICGCRQQQQLGGIDFVRAKSTESDQFLCIFMACVEGKKKSFWQVRKLSASDKFFA
jgi:hypothetical protein